MTHKYVICEDIHIKRANTLKYICFTHISDGRISEEVEVRYVCVRWKVRPSHKKNIFLFKICIFCSQDIISRLAKGKWFLFKIHMFHSQEINHKGACCKEIKINMFCSQEIRRARVHMCVRGVEALRPRGLQQSAFKHNQRCCPCPFSFSFLILSLSNTYHVSVLHYDISYVFIISYSWGIQ